MTSDSTSPSGRRPARTARLRLALVAVLSLVILGCLGSLVYLAGSRASDDASLGDRVSSVFRADNSVQRERETTMSQAKQFVLRLFTYGPELLDDENTMPEYRERVLEVTTPKFGAEFEENAAIAESTVAQAGYGSRAEVFSTGVVTLDADSATVLVAGQFTNSYPNPRDAEKRLDADSLPFRWELKMNKVDGTWLVDGYTPLTGEPEEAAP